jgi:hypothetical protein
MFNDSLSWMAVTQADMPVGARGPADTAGSRLPSRLARGRGSLQLALDPGAARFVPAVCFHELGRFFANLLT